MTIAEAYDPAAREPRQPLSDVAVVAIAFAAVAGGWPARWPVAVVLGVALAILVTVVDHRDVDLRDVDHRSRPRSWPVVVLILLVCCVSAARSQVAWEGLVPNAVGPFDGWVRLIDDPQPVVRATRVIVEVDGERFEVFGRGRAGQLRMRTWRGGDLVRVHGERVDLAPERAARVAWQHVVGELRIEWAGDVVPGAPLAVASNRVRAAIERGASVLPADDSALLRGLVIGDDRDQPPAMVERFRASGLAHLTAVSGVIACRVLVVVVAVDALETVVVVPSRSTGRVESTLVGSVLAEGRLESTRSCSTLSATVACRSSS